MGSPDPPTTLRRSIAIPSQLAAAVEEVAPQELHGSFNGVVRVALEEFVARRRAEWFQREMERMAEDPEIRHELGRIEDAFRGTEGDGL